VSEGIRTSGRRDHNEALVGLSEACKAQCGVKLGDERDADLRFVVWANSSLSRF
jgi:hypothetical protein